MSKSRTTLNKVIFRHDKLSRTNLYLNNVKHKQKPTTWTNTAVTLTKGFSSIPLCRGPLSLRSTRNSNLVRKRPSDSEMLEYILNPGRSEFRVLSEVATTGIPYLRAPHLTYNNLLLKILKKVFKQQTEYSSVHKTFGCILWHSSKSPTKAVSITLSEETGPATH